MGSLFWFLALPSNQLSPRPLPDPAAPTFPPSAPILPPPLLLPLAGLHGGPPESGAEGETEGQPAGNQQQRRGGQRGRRPWTSTHPGGMQSAFRSVFVFAELRFSQPQLLIVPKGLVDVPFDNPRHTPWACEISDFAPRGLMARPKSFVRVGMMTVSSSVQ